MSKPGSSPLVAALAASNFVTLVTVLQLLNYPTGPSYIGAMAVVLIVVTAVAILTASCQALIDRRRESRGPVKGARR